MRYEINKKAELSLVATTDEDKRTLQFMRTQLFSKYGNNWQLGYVSSEDSKGLMFRESFETLEMAFRVEKRKE